MTTEYVEDAPSWADRDAKMPEIVHFKLFESVQVHRFRTQTWLVL